MMQIQYRDENGDLQLVRAGRALAANPFPEEETSAYAAAVGLAANTSVNHTTTHNPATQVYNSLNLGLFVDVPRVLRARRVYAEWDMNAAPSADHWYGVYVGVYDTAMDAFVTPLKPVLTSRRNNAPGGGHETASFAPMFPAAGNNNGQIVGSHAFTEVPVVIPASWYALVDSDPNGRLRFIMSLRNASATAIADPWRAMLTVFCF